MTTYEVITDLTRTASQGTHVMLDWAMQSVASNIECKREFFQGWRPTRPAEDLFLLGGAAFCIDKLDERKAADDAWTRALELRLPVADPSAFNDSGIANALRFLTGDHWSVDAYLQSEGPLAHLPPLTGAPDPIADVGAVTLFSGGLDSLCGTIDLLESDDSLRLGLVSHYDGGQATSRQEQLHARLAAHYGADRVLLRRLWLRPAPQSAFQRSPTPEVAETTTRGRSLLFLTAAMALASASGPEVPVYLPENGYIAINVPLTRARAGSASTRTTHPHYLELLSAAAQRVGVDNPLVNPYQFKTKGEMLRDSRNRKLLKSLAPASVSCSHPEAARMRQLAQGNCGYCFPCLIRRAALATVGWDNEPLPWDVLTDNALIENIREKRGSDLRAVVNGVFADRPDTDLIRNAPLPTGTHAAHLDVWRRGNMELRDWFVNGAKGSLADVIGRLT